MYGFMTGTPSRLAAIALATAALAACGGGGEESSTIAPGAAASDGNRASAQAVTNAVPLNNQVTLISGDIAGKPADAAGILSFKGIPYAAAPMGNLRWKEPQPMPRWSGTRDATTFGARCWGASAFAPTVNPTGASEDCLFANVWTGARSASEKRPVMVYIHGGGFQFDAASNPLYNGTNLAKKGVVVVNFNYRLGVFGFLARADLDAESGNHKSGMYGILDQVAALQWVRNNISAFGGDAGNITVFGESAGAHSVGILMASPLATGAFQKAIAESGAFWESEHGAMKTHAQAQALGATLGPKVNASNAAQLRAVSALELQNATNWTFASANDPGVTNYSPSVDGYVLPDNPYVRFMRGQQNKVPLLVGWNAAEGLVFGNRGLPSSTAQAFTDAASQEFGAGNLASFLQLYPATTQAQASHSAATLAGDQIISYQTWGMANQHQKSYLPVYTYFFEQSSAYTPVATHVTEVGYVFGNLGPKNGVSPSAQDLALSDVMQSYWTHFARSGNPNGGGLAQWPLYGGAGTQTLHIGNTVAAGTESGTARFEFLNRFRVNGLITVSQ